MSDNMGLETIDSSDYVSPTPINNNFQKLDALGLDYVVESGRSGEWWYRKWKSGRAECGIDDKNFGTVSVTKAWGALFQSGQMSFGAYPFSFAARPLSTITLNYSDNTLHSSYVALVTTNSTTQAPKFTIMDPFSGSPNNVHFGIYVCGRYK